MRMNLLLAFLVVFASSFAVVHGDHNLLSFERMGAGAPGGWKVDGNGYSWIAEIADGPLGAGAAHVEFKGPGEVTLCSPARAMRAEVSHVAALWLRSEPAGAIVGIEVIDNDNGVAIKETFTAESGWRLFHAQGVLQKAVKGRYYLKLRARASDCTLWLDGLWLGEHDGNVDANWRPALHAAGVALEPEAGWGVVAGDAPFKVNARVAGGIEGCQLRLHAVNTLGATADLPPIPLDKKGVWSGAFEVCGGIAKSFGMIRVEGTVVDSQGQAVSPISETLLARVPEPIPGPLPESYFGIHVALREPDVAAVAKLGYKWCRMHDASGITKWGRIEPEPGKWVWHDDEVALARRYGLSIVGLLDTAPPWHTGADPDSGYFSVCHAPKDIGLWRNYVRRIVSHYAGSIDEWEVWNEPWDMKRFFQEGSPQLYVELLKAAYEEAKAANPKSTIIGVDTYPPMWEMAVLAMGAYPYYDMLSWHRYDPTLQGRPNDAIARVASRLRKAQESYGTPRPILCTEGGPDTTVFHGSFFSFADPVIMGDWSEGADRYSRLFLSAIAAGNRRFIAYSVHNNSYHGWLTHMMAEPGFLLRPMHAALAALAHFVDGAKYEGRLSPAPDISAHVFNQPNPRSYAQAPSTIVVLAADGAEPENLPRLLPPDIACFDRWGNPIAAPTQATRSLTYLVASGNAREELLRSLQPKSAKSGDSNQFSVGRHPDVLGISGSENGLLSPLFKPDIAALVDAALGSLTAGAPSLWTLFSTQGSLAVMGGGTKAVTATRTELRTQSDLADKFRLPAGTQVTGRVVQPAGPFTVGSFDLANGDNKWTATFAAVPDGPGGNWRFTSLTILSGDGQPSAEKAERVTGVLKIWENALREASTANLLETLSTGPCCLMAATLNGEYFMLANPIYLITMMNTAVLWGPAATSKMELSRVVISENVATVLGQWEVSSLAFGTAPYAITATLFEDNGAWKIASMCASAGE